MLPEHVPCAPRRTKARPRGALPASARRPQGSAVAPGSVRALRARPAGLDAVRRSVSTVTDAATSRF